MNVLVYGWYNHQNLGDQLFIDAFKILFPEIIFTFTDTLIIEDIKAASAIFIGGGSFLFSDPNISDECLLVLKTKKLLYIGVGAETNIHDVHKILMRHSSLIALRSSVGIEHIKKLNHNVIIIPDIVYCLRKTINVAKKHKSVLLLPNIYVVPQNTDPHWKYNAWDHFKFEYSQFLDHLINNDFEIGFFPMCVNSKENDRNAAHEIINCMHHRGDYLINHQITDICELFSQYETIITQRYHGIILAEMLNIPYISIFHHDKLKQSYLNAGIFTSYHEISKHSLIDQFNTISNHKSKQTLPIELNMYDDLKVAVSKILNGE